MSKRIPIFTRWQSKGAIGYVEGDTFYKSIDDDHMFVREPALCCNLDALLAAQNCGAVYLEARVKSLQKTLRCKLAMFHNPETGFEINEGHGPQFGVPLDLWDIVDETARASEKPKCYFYGVNCNGPLWKCRTCDHKFCAFHSRVNDLGENVECMDCERARTGRVIHKIPPKPHIPQVSIIKDRE
jgi:hypothetical protein